MKIIYTDSELLRVDKFLSTHFDDLSRSYIQKLLKDQKVLVNNKIVKANYRLSNGDEIEVGELEKKELEIIPENLPLDIIYEDDQLMVINKPVGMVVHPAPGHPTGTLVNAIMYHCKDRLSSINGTVRPGIVHRIDKDTSGLLIVCKTDIAHQKIAEQLEAHTIHRLYEALVYNNIKEDEGIIDAPIGRGEKDRKKMAINHKNGKEAVTHYKVLERLDSHRFTYLQLELETGRTHQIRVHLTQQGNPLIGDPVYGPAKGIFSAKGQMLHAKEVGFIHPITNEYMEFSVELPSQFRHILGLLRKRK
jgi:23S rRNA pseudouridine1911/1915/1917 synthase